MLFGMSRRAASIVLTPEEGSTLERWSRARSIPARLVQRARIVRLAAEGRPSQDIAEELDISRPTVQLWRQRFLALRLAGLEKDAPRTGRRPRISPPKVRLVGAARLGSATFGRTHRDLPVKPGRCGTCTHDYKRHGTATLFAALNVRAGKVIGDCMPRHRHQ